MKEYGGSFNNFLSKFEKVFGLKNRKARKVCTKKQDHILLKSQSTIETITLD